MSNTEASPVSETWGAVMKELADILRQHPGGVKFLDRIIDEEAPDPELRYICRICCQWTWGRDGRFVEPHNTFVCNWCIADGRHHDLIPKEGT